MPSSAFHAASAGSGPREPTCKRLAAGPGAPCSEPAGLAGNVAEGSRQLPRTRRFASAEGYRRWDLDTTPKTLAEIADCFGWPSAAYSPRSSASDAFMARYPGASRGHQVAAQKIPRVVACLHATSGLMKARPGCRTGSRSQRTPDRGPEAPTTYPHRARRHRHPSLRLPGGGLAPVSAVSTPAVRSRRGR
jgi:hypothetical protein